MAYNKASEWASIGLLLCDLDNDQGLVARFSDPLDKRALSPCFHESKKLYSE